MKSMFLLAVIYSSFTFASSFDCEPVKEVKWDKIAEGVEWAKYDLAFTPYHKEEKIWEETKSRSVTIRAFKVDLSKNKLQFVSTEADIACNPQTDRYIQNLIVDQKADVVGAVNGNFFVMPKGKILGLALDESKLWNSDLSTQTISSSGVFSIQDEKTSLVRREEFISQYGDKLSKEDAKKFTFAVQAYPRLLIDSKMQIGDGVAATKVPRTSIGISEDSDDIIIVTIDARGMSDKTGMSLFEYAHMLKKPACGVAQKTALNLDGGGSSAFAIPSLKIAEQADRCRHLGNVLTIQTK